MILLHGIAPDQTGVCTLIQCTFRHGAVPAFPWMLVVQGMCLSFGGPLCGCRVRLWLVDRQGAAHVVADEAAKGVVWVLAERAELARP